MHLKVSSSFLLTIQCMELPKITLYFFVFSSRIKVECTFGDINLRWEIFWRPLSFSLFQNVKVIDTCLQLHKFITEFCKQNSFPVNSDNTIFNDDSWRFFLHETYSGICGGEDDLCCNEDGSVFYGGHPTLNEKRCTDHGKCIWKNVCSMIAMRQLQRPQVNWFCINNRVVDNY